MRFDRAASPTRIPNAHYLSSALETTTWQSVGLRMFRLQRWEGRPYFAAFFLHIPDMRSFVHVHEIVKICPRSPTVLIEPVFRYRTPKSDRLLASSVRNDQKFSQPGAHIARNWYRLRTIQIHEHERLFDMQMFYAIFGAKVINIYRGISNSADS